MKILSTSALVAMLCLGAQLVAEIEAFTAAPVPLIIDTDIGGGACKDVDDVMAICIANALADKGEAELLAVVQNTSPEQCAGWVDPTL